MANELWHTTMLSYIDNDYKGVVRKCADGTEHNVDAYDSLNDMGIQFQSESISAEDVQTRDLATDLDWVFCVESAFVRRVHIGNLAVCGIPNDTWESAIAAVKNTVYLYTGRAEWIQLDSKEAYTIDIADKRRTVWIGTPRTFSEVCEATCLQNMVSEAGTAFFESMTTPLDTVRIVYGRCVRSMYLLDALHRDYINTHEFVANEVVAIKSVAGSGKTTTLLTLAKRLKNKRILYLAFNKSLIGEVKEKLAQQKIKNMYPCTFDSLLYNCYSSIRKDEPTIVNLSPQTIQDIVPWLKKKPFALRKECVKLYVNFCRDIDYANPKDFALKTTGKDKPLLYSLWEKTLAHQLITFDSLRKLALVNKWFKGYVDKSYDMIVVDETQDFDMAMLRMLLDDTTLPKLFVGDPKQSIYEWRGCINGFAHMPADALIVEFYSTFRVGDPACSRLRDIFPDCWMISKSANTTILSDNTDMLADKPYTYLFRTWKQLLRTAQTMKRVWIQGYDSKIDSIRKLHSILSVSGRVVDDDEFEDDLPKFLKTINRDDLDSLISNIDDNLVDKSECMYKLYTIHSYKGLEDDTVRIANDIDKSDVNVYYVALTRGRHAIVEDAPPVATAAQMAADRLAFTLGSAAFTNTVANTIVPAGEATFFEKVLGVVDTPVKKGMYGLDASQYPAKMGKPWKEPEIQQLLVSIQAKTPIAEIAAKHERTVGSIETYRRKLATDYWCRDKRSMIDIEMTTGLTKSQIEDAINKHNAKEITKRVAKEKKSGGATMFAFMGGK